MIKLLAVIVGTAFLVSCQQKGAPTDQQQFVNLNVDKWKKELIINGEVGTPCEDDYMKWIAKNPESYYGLPSSIDVKIFDANKDQVNDLLLYFPAGNACTGGHEEGSDFVKLIYSNGNDFLSNSNLRDKIASKIEQEYYAQTNTDVERAIFSIKEFNTDISGSYQLWTKEDPDCCASVEGSFKYNPFTFKIEITHQIAK